MGRRSLAPYGDGLGAELGALDAGVGKEGVALAGRGAHTMKKELPMATKKKGAGLMMVWTDVPADKEKEFNRWYNEEHLAERLALPGFLNGARYEAVKGGPKHLAVYELESIAALETPEYKKIRSNPTAWTKQCSPDA